MPKHELKKASESELAAEIRTAIGAGPDEQVSVTTPQFERAATDPAPAAPPGSLEEWDALRTASRSALRERGLRIWSDMLLAAAAPDTLPCQEGAAWVSVDETDGEPPGTHELWLLPGEWYSSIPRGFRLVGLFGGEEEFEPGKSDDDIRFGCLAYGIVIPKEPKRGR